LLRAVEPPGAVLAAAEAEDDVPRWRSDVPRLAGIRGSPADCGVATAAGWDWVDWAVAKEAAQPRASADTEMKTLRRILRLPLKLPDLANGKARALIRAGQVQLPLFTGSSRSPPREVLSARSPRPLWTKCLWKRLTEEFVAVDRQHRAAHDELARG
jgi:hypothetical protein